MKYLKSLFVLCCTVMSVGCNTPTGIKPDQAKVVGLEAAWIREGEPIIFEGTSWYPQDDIENLFENELYLLGEYQGVEYFVEKMDVRPYNRLYTKFGKNRFRLFEKNKS